jgi:anti-sigma factor RsiW
MDCRNFHRNLEDYLDGGLDFAERFSMERHAEQCFACGKDLSAARGLRRLTDSLVQVKAPADFEARVCREIARRKSRGIFTRVRDFLAFGFEWQRFAFAAAVCAMLIFGIVAAKQVWMNKQIPETAVNSNPAFDNIEDEFEEAPGNYEKEALDLLLVGPNNYHSPEQLPRRIHVRYGSPSEEYFIRNVSH